LFLPGFPFLKLSQPLLQLRQRVVRVDCVAFAKRLRSVCASFLQRYRSVYAALTQRLRHVCTMYA
jgi:hypothetical protein